MHHRSATLRIDFAPILAHTFFEKAKFERLFGNELFQLSGLVTEILDLVRSRGVRGFASKATLASFQELLRPAVAQTFCDAFASAEFHDRDFATQVIEHDADFFFRRVLLARRPVNIAAKSLLGS